MPASQRLQQKTELLSLLEEKQRRLDEAALFRYSPYPKQSEFHTAGGTHRERLLRAGNQLGKTLAGGCEMAMHLTGLYPDWWEGKTFDHPIIAWAGGVTSETTRDNPQRVLFGGPDQLGTGTVPKKSIIKEPVRALGIRGLFDYVRVKHEPTGAASIVYFKAYEKGREKWQGPSVDVVWFDEEPPPPIYSEGLTRTNATKGITFLTFTPLLGMSEVVRRFLSNQGPDRHDTNMTIDDVDHYTDAERKVILDSYPPYEREARAKGIPILGSGRIFPIAEEPITVEAFKIPDHWPLIGGLDFGWDHPTAAVKTAWDRDNDCMYVCDAYKRREATPLIHAASLKPWGDIPWAWPHDGLQHDKGSGVQLAKQYKDNGLKMLANKITFEDGSNGVEAGIHQMLERMQTGRLKVFGHLSDWFDEFRLYHRKDGKVVKEFDDLMSASRYAMMGLRFAETMTKNTKSMEFTSLW